MSPDLTWLDLLPGDPQGARERFTADWFPDGPDGFETRGSVFLHRVSRPRPDRADGLVEFGQESDGVFTLLHGPSGTNPDVYYEGLGDGLLAEREPLDGYLMLFALTRAALDGPFSGMAFTDEKQLQEVVGPLRQVPLRPLRWPCPETDTYAGPGLVVLAGAAEPGSGVFEVYVGASHPDFLDPLRDLDLSWEVFDDGR